MKKFASKATTADELINQMNAKYPNFTREEDLKGIAEKLYNICNFNLPQKSG